ncbi:MAG: hypothetical protein GXP53_05325 [Deltaproteobacteria bacterium]|nr:hypothetical protein [Deltaproteobacteria bacterium]
MNTLKWIGIFLLFSSGLVFGYEALSMLMKQDGSHMVTHTLVMLGGSDAFDWIDSLPLRALQRGGAYIIKMPLYALFAAVGVVCLVISGLFTK